jgi:hypothetical protein
MIELNSVRRGWSGEARLLQGCVRHIGDVVIFPFKHDFHALQEGGAGTELESGKEANVLLLGAACGPLGGPVDKLARDCPVLVGGFGNLDFKGVGACVFAHGHVEFKVLDALRVQGDLLLEVPGLGTNAILGFTMLGAEAGKSRDFRVHGGFFNDQWIAGGDGFDFCIGQCSGINVLNMSDRLALAQDAARALVDAEEQKLLAEFARKAEAHEQKTRDRPKLEFTVERERTTLETKLGMKVESPDTPLLQQEVDTKVTKLRNESDQALASLKQNEEIDKLIATVGQRRAEWGERWPARSDPAPAA